jgi:hypothetical protein
MIRIQWTNRRWFSAEIEPGRGAWAEHFVWTLLHRGAIVGTGYAADANAAMEAAAGAADALTPTMPMLRTVAA